MSSYTDFISENTAPVGTKRIGVYNKKGKRVFGIMLGNLSLKNKGQKLYSFGALSDIHYQSNTAAGDFKTALEYLQDKVDFICICGDLTNNGTDTELAEYKACVDQNSNGTPVYAISGNHEAASRYEPTGNSYVTSERIEQGTGKPLYYSFAVKPNGIIYERENTSYDEGDDVFIMCGEYDWNALRLFQAGELEWLQGVLQSNENNRCFVFFHVFPRGEDWNDSGNAQGIYTSDIFSGTQGNRFLEIIKQHKNVILFHGHSHLKFELQKLDYKANYSKALGFHSVHIPSLSVPREADLEDVNNDNIFYQTIYSDSEGYVVDVYENGIHLRGRDFVKGEFLPIASYWIDTTLQIIEPNTYTDSTGIKQTG